MAFCTPMFPSRPRLCRGCTDIETFTLTQKLKIIENQPSTHMSPQEMKFSPKEIDISPSAINISGAVMNISPKEIARSSKEINISSAAITF